VLFGKFQTVITGSPPSQPHTFFAQLLFNETFAQTYSFADANYADVALGSTPICNALLDIFAVTV